MPRAFAPLLAPARYKGAYGGRGGAKSHFFAEQLLVRCYVRPTRAVCIREVQNSIRDSVRQLLVDKIQALGVGRYFDVLDTEIRGRNGSLIIFRGMNSFTAESIKSLEGYDIAWIEEAQTLTQRSFELLRPTLRNEGSEIWASWNPRHRTDPVDRFFRRNPPPNAVSVFVNPEDNPWLPQVLREEMAHDFADDPETAEHVWHGAYGVTHGSILARQVDRAEAEGRINDQVAYDPDGPGVEISSDLGFRDTASWWFWQRRQNGFALLDYDQDSGLDAEEWCPRLHERLMAQRWPLGKIWLPHDARTRTFQSRHSAVEQFLKHFTAPKVSIVPRSSKTDRINAARTILKRCEMHASRCAAGLEGLRAWEFEWNSETGSFSKEPRHDWASHPGDAFSYGAQVMVEAAPPAHVEPGKIVQISAAGELPPLNQVTLEDLWEANRRRWRETRI